VAVAGTSGSDVSVAPDASSVVDTGIERKRVLVSDPATAAIVSAIAGDLIVVESFVPPGENGHTYEPVPSDAVRAATADLYIENGMELNEAVSRFVRANYRAGTPEVTLSDAIPTAEVISTDSAAEIAAHGHAHSFNAHFWTDPVYAIWYAEEIVEALVVLDPQNTDAFRTRAAEFIARLRVLDSRFRTAIASIPPQNRKLVVYHDSWSYFGRRYGIPIVGAIQPVTFSEPSAEEIRRMIDQIRAETVPAFFGSEVFPSDVLDAIAAETGARYFSDLSDEELPGVPGTAEHSYEGMMIRNVRLITEALGGDIGILADLVPGAAS
jgi:ABC-type Zn uptake system ZnuABC Zn-binding protein ZnuA